MCAATIRGTPHHLLTGVRVEVAVEASPEPSAANQDRHTIYYECARVLANSVYVARGGEPSAAVFLETG